MDVTKSFFTHPVAKQKLVFIGYLVAISSLALSLSARVITYFDASFVAHIALNEDSWGVPVFILIIIYGFYLVLCSCISGTLALCLIKTKRVSVSLREGLPSKYYGNRALNATKVLIIGLYLWAVLVYFVHYTYINPLVMVLDVASYVGYTYYVLSVIALGGVVYTNFVSWVRYKLRLAAAQ